MKLTRKCSLCSVKRTPLQHVSDKITTSLSFARPAAPRISRNLMRDLKDDTLFDRQIIESLFHEGSFADPLLLHELLNPPRLRHTQYEVHVDFLGHISMIMACLWSFSGWFMVCFWVDIKVLPYEVPVTPFALLGNLFSELPEHILRVRGYLSTALAFTTFPERGCSMLTTLIECKFAIPASLKYGSLARTCAQESYHENPSSHSSRSFHRHCLRRRPEAAKQERSTRPGNHLRPSVPNPNLSQQGLPNKRPVAQCGSEPIGSEPHANR